MTRLDAVEKSEGGVCARKQSSFLDLDVPLTATSVDGSSLQLVDHKNN